MVSLTLILKTCRKLPHSDFQTPICENMGKLEKEPNESGSERDVLESV